MSRVAVANLAGKQIIKMAFSQFAELWELIDLLVRKDFRQANLADSANALLSGYRIFDVRLRDRQVEVLYRSYGKNSSKDRDSDLPTARKKCKMGSVSRSCQDCVCFKVCRDHSRPEMG